MSIADYAGRRIDILAFQGQTEHGEQLLDQILFGEGNSGQICTGILKLCQRWLIEFMTEQGTLRYLPDRGCLFMRELRRGTLRTESAVTASFRFSELVVRQNLQGEETDEMPDDERLANADLTRLVISPERMDLYIAITSLAGASRKLILPTSTLPG